MKPSEFREQIIKSIKTFVRKYRPGTLNVQCPLLVEVAEQRRANYRQKTCGTCNWRSDVCHGKFATGDYRYDCRRAHDADIKVSQTTPACPWYED